MAQLCNDHWPIMIAQSLANCASLCTAMSHSNFRQVFLTKSFMLLLLLVVAAGRC
jgi:hypothetical protein